MRNQKRGISALKKKNKIILIAAGIVLSLLAAALILFYILEENPDPDLKGLWVYDEYTSYEFTEQGTGYMYLDDQQYEFTYETSLDSLKMDFALPEILDCTYEFHVRGDILTLIGGEGTIGGTYTLYRE